MPVHAGRVPPGRKCTAMAPHPTLVTPSFPFGRSSRARRAPIGDVDVCPSRAYIPLSYHALSPHPLPDPRTYPRGRNLQPVAPTPPPYPRPPPPVFVSLIALPQTPCPTPTKHQYDPTIEDQYQKTLEVDGKARHVEILDTAGQDEYVRRRGEREEWEKKCAPVLEKRTRACPLLRVATCLCEASARAFYVSERARVMCDRHPVYPTRVQKT